MQGSEGRVEACLGTALLVLWENLLALEHLTFGMSAVAPHPVFLLGSYRGLSKAS